MEMGIGRGKKRGCRRSIEQITRPLQREFSRLGCQGRILRRHDAVWEGNGHGVAVKPSTKSAEKWVTYCTCSVPNNVIQPLKASFLFWLRSLTPAKLRNSETSRKLETRSLEIARFVNGRQLRCCTLHVDKTDAGVY